MENTVLTVVIPRYIRQIKTSEQTRPVYYMWNGKTIRTKKGQLPLSYVRDEFNKKELRSSKIITIQHLKKEYVLAVVVKGKYYVCENEGDVVQQYNAGNKVILCKISNDLKSIEKVIANPNTVGNPGYRSIKGQDIYSGMDEYLRATIMREIKEHYSQYMGHLKGFKIPLDAYPCILLCELHDTFDNIYESNTFAGGQAWDVGNRLFPYIKAFPDLLQQLGILENDDRKHITGEQYLFTPIENANERKLIFHLIKDGRAVVKNNPNYSFFDKKIASMIRKSNVKHSKSVNKLPNLKFNK